MAVKRTKRAAPVKPPEIRLNLGCGGTSLPGFINVDAHVGSGDNYRRADVRSLPFPPDYADYALMDNVLEHLDMTDVPIALYELRRVLKPGGRAVIVVPDFRFLAKAWLQMEEGSFNPYIWLWLAEAIYGNQAHTGEYHRTPMTPKYLNYVLQMVGFRKYEMVLYTAGAQMPEKGKYPGVSEEGNAFNAVRNDVIFVDIRK